MVCQWVLRSHLGLAGWHRGSTCLCLPAPGLETCTATLAFAWVLGIHPKPLMLVEQALPLLSIFPALLFCSCPSMSTLKQKAPCHYKYSGSPVSPASVTRTSHILTETKNNHSRGCYTIDYQHASLIRWLVMVVSQ